MSFFTSQNSITRDFQLVKSDPPSMWLRVTMDGRGNVTAIEDHDWIKVEGVSAYEGMTLEQTFYKRVDERTPFGLYLDAAQVFLAQLRADCHAAATPNAAYHYYGSE